MEQIGYSDLLQSYHRKHHIKVANDRERESVAYPSMKLLTGRVPTLGWKKRPFLCAVSLHRQLTPQMGSCMAFDYTQMGTRYQEDERVYAHPHDLHHRFDALT
jgi:hypothetical protein